MEYVHIPQIGFLEPILMKSQLVAQVQQVEKLLVLQLLVLLPPLESH
jgi:hypothetical protein